MQRDEDGFPPLVPGGFLALDLSRHVGFCLGREDCNRPQFGTIHLPESGGEGARYVAWENKLFTLMKLAQPVAMILESHLPLPAFNDTDVMRQQVSLRAVCYMEAHRAYCPVSEIDPQTVRGEILGQYRFPKGKAKEEAMAWCRKRGWPIGDDNQGDAGLIWEWHRRRVTRTPMAAGPLWREAY